jgi:DNA-binding protein YbaB
MFDQLKQLGKLKELKDVLEKTKKEMVKEGVKVVVNGRMEVEEIKLNPQLNLETQEKIVKDCINETMKAIQAEAAQKMMQM